VANAYNSPSPQSADPSWTSRRSRRPPTRPRTDGFRKENNRLLGVPVDGTAMVRAGSMIAYTGELTFTGKSSAEGGQMN